MTDLVIENGWECATCERELPSRLIRLCSACHITGYCSELCQRIHWPKHKPDCLVWKLIPPPEHRITKIYPFTNINYLLFASALGWIAKEKGGVLIIWPPNKLLCTNGNTTEHMLGFTFDTTIKTLECDKEEHIVAFALGEGFLLRIHGRQRTELAEKLVMITKAHLKEHYINLAWSQGETCIVLNIQESDLSRGKLSLMITPSFMEKIGI